MPYPVQNLIQGRGDPVCVHPTDPVQQALNLMIEHDFSQLPVIDDARRPQGLISRQSILRAHLSLGLPASDFLVSDAMNKTVKADKYSLEDDLFELIDRLRDTSAVLIVDREKRLIDIVTSYDAMEYFRRRAEDLMYVEDIEISVRDLAQAAFVGKNGKIDEDERQKAIADVMPSRGPSKNQYRTALMTYLKLQGGEEETEINQQWFERSFSRLVPPRRTKAFEELSLYEYIELWLHKSRWDLYRPFFHLEPKAIRRMLKGVCETRNVLAHFRGEVTAIQRKELRYCDQWLKDHPLGFPVSWPSPTVGKPARQTVLSEAGPPYQASVESGVDIMPISEELGPTDSRYAPLAIRLQGEHPSSDRVEYAFQEVEDLIDGPLPASARKHRAWWANDPVGHIQARQWLDVGWRVARVNTTDEIVTFARIKDRESAYIRFFSAFQTDLDQVEEFPLKERSPDGQSWLTVATLPDSRPPSLYFIVSFTRSKQFRVELYIDTGDQGKNKRVFGWLEEGASQLEASLDEDLSWERLDQNRASRIAVYRPGSITDDAEQLAQLHAWAVDTMPRFYQVFAEPANQALASAEQSRD